jgi:acyl CoA:acetate/3-ketoacid CoA transferase alpha subunit
VSAVQIAADADAAVADIADGATVLIGGFGTAGSLDPMVT